MPDRPMIFSAPMVRALLDGRKTQTRRVLRVPGWAAEIDEIGDDGYTLWCVSRESGCIAPALPQYLPHDRLWVRENCATWEGDHRDAVYRADMTQADWNDVKHDASSAPWKLRPSIHMPRWASRLTLIVTDVRVQRLQEISEKDAKAEGVRAGDWPDRPRCSCDDDDCVACSHYPALYKPAFRHIWNSLHGPDAWDANPWVCAITFTVHRCNIARMEADNA